MRTRSKSLLCVLLGCFALGACSTSQDDGGPAPGDSGAPDGKGDSGLDGGVASEAGTDSGRDGASGDSAAGRCTLPDADMRCPQCGSTWGLNCPAVPACGLRYPCALANQQAVALSLGDTRSCAVAQGGQVTCWGWNYSAGGGSSTFAEPSPTPVVGLKNAISVSAGYWNSCAVQSDGTVWCWGQDAISPVAVTGLTGAIAVSVGESHACALAADGTVRCWGDNGYGQLGVGRDAPSSAVPVKVTGLENVVSLSAGTQHTCALRKDGTIACWGFNEWSVPATVSSSYRFVAAAAGATHHCAVTDQGDVQCWGSNVDGQLGDGTTDDSFTPVSVPGVAHAVAVAGGSSHACALLDSGDVQCWGRAQGGQLGTGVVHSAGYREIGKPATVSGALHAVAISAGNSNTCVMGKDGSLRCWGAVYHGRTVGGIAFAGFPTPLCGFGASTSDNPADNADGGVGDASDGGVEDLSIDPGSIVASGWQHSCAIRPNGTVACWGNNDFGQSTPPVGTFISLSAGWSHTCGIRTDHTVACWGSASSPPAEKFAVLSGSSGFVCGILTNGSLRCWGDNGYGQTDPPAGAFSAVSSGGDHVCAIRSDHTIACWGLNDYGQASPPVGSFKAISAGTDTTCAVRMDGTLSCWGKVDKQPEGTFKSIAVRDENRGCGIRTDGSATCWDSGSSGFPAPSGAFTAIALGDFYACGMRGDGKVACWGDSYFGNSAGQATPPDDQFLSIAIGSSSCGGDYLCGIRTDGSIICWGQLRAGAPEGSFTALSAGLGHACAIRSDQTIVCWMNPVGTVPPGKYRAVSAGYDHDCALTVEGKPVCWGSNSHGQSTAPDETFSSIACGYRHTCAMRPNGSVVCWGAIATGPDSPVWSSTTSFSPAQSPAGAFTSLAIGSHSCGIRPDSSVECWDQGFDRGSFTGSAMSGQACGFEFYRDAPDVPTPAGPFSSLASNLGSFCGLRANGTAECWGLGPKAACSVPPDSFTALAVGAYVCGIRASDARLSCWGSIVR